MDSLLMSDQLDLRKTYRAILDAARDKRFISYGDLAKANDANWPKVRYKMNHHLGDLVEEAASRNWPMPSAIVVNMKNIGTGLLDGSERDGFVSAAKQCGFEVSDPETFVKEQQQAMFDWAETAPDELELTEDEKSGINKNGPHFVRLFGPLLDVLRSLGGAAKPKQVYAEVAKSPFVTEKELNATKKDGSSLYENEIQWARFYLAKADLIASKKRGIWQLTPAGRETHLSRDASTVLYRAVKRRLRTEEEEHTDEINAPADSELGDIFDDPNRRFWFVGAFWDEGGGDQTARFLGEGIWQNGHDDKFAEHVARMQPGDRMAIKATFVQKYELPFENRDIPVSCMRIKATGTVIEATSDGRTVKVDWQPFNQSKDWYFYTYRTTISEADASDEYARRLIQFAFSDYEQDYEFWLRLPHWAKRYRAREPTLTDIELEEEEASADAELDEAKIVPYGITNILEDGCFLSQEFLASACAHLKNKKNLILQGPPGTGKTWLAKRLGYALIGTKDRAVIRKRMRSIQFHPSLSYEDFVRGWRPDGTSQLSLIDGCFLEAVETARAEPDRPFVIIIEEINRGNPAQIFGEMLTLLEKDKRSEEEAIELAYRHDQGERVFIPRNLFVIGTMNIADRSLALVDLALRRRFAFLNLETSLNDSWRKWCIEKAGIDESVLSQIQKLIAELNDEISTDRSLGPQFTIGHSYVTPVVGETVADARAWFRDIVETEIQPLLEEYWFDNLDKAAKSKVRLLEGI